MVLRKVFGELIAATLTLATLTKIPKTPPDPGFNALPGGGGEFRGRGVSNVAIRVGSFGTGGRGAVVCRFPLTGRGSPFMMNAQPSPNLGLSGSQDGKVSSGRR